MIAYLEKLTIDSYRLHSPKDLSFSIHKLDGELLVTSDQSSVDFTLISNEINPTVLVRWKDGSSQIAGVRHLNDLGIINFRDIGGYFNHQNRQVNYQTFYRGPALIAENEDYDRLNSLGIKSIVDLRSQYEINKVQDIIPVGAKYYHAPAMRELNDWHKGTMDVEVIKKNRYQQNPEEFLINAYRNAVFNNPSYKTLLDLLITDDTPLYFHCSAGKDRTGIAAILILLLLGVDEDTIKYEYLLTNIYRQDLINALAERDNIPFEEAMKIEGVIPEYINLVFDIIKGKYNTYEDYFLVEYGIDEEKRNILIERYTTNNE